MSDWDFLHDMNELGYSHDDIVEAAASGYAPYAELSNEWLNAHFEDEPNQSFKSRAGHPFSTLEQIQIFEDLIDCAHRHFENTGRYLQVWGELGEIYAEITLNLRRHETNRAGSDGTINGKLVEVKTISPEKTGHNVLVKRQADFEQLLIVRINENFEFQSRLFDRNELQGETGKFLRGRLNDALEND